MFGACYNGAHLTLFDTFFLNTYEISQLLIYTNQIGNLLNCIDFLSSEKNTTRIKNPWKVICNNVGKTKITKIEKKCCIKLNFQYAKSQPEVNFLHFHIKQPLPFSLTKLKKLYRNIGPVRTENYLFLHMKLR